MNWLKYGLIFNPKNKFNWASGFALQPTPLLLDDAIRVYCGLRDEEGISRIGFVDLSPDNPQNVLKYSSEPVLDIGSPGSFDDNGVVPTVVFQEEDKIFLYYAGYQVLNRVRFIAYGGLAISYDKGLTFERYKLTPVFERTDDDLLFRVPHSILHENGRYKVWYGGGSFYKQGQIKTLPVYNIRYTEAETPYKFTQPGKLVLDMKEGEYRVGRPYVVRTEDSFLRMFYGYSSELSPFKIGYAESTDEGHSWIRKDEEVGITLSSEGWDSKSISYPAVVIVNDSVYMLYNGNNYGEEGFGCAKLINW